MSLTVIQRVLGVEKKWFGVGFRTLRCDLGVSEAGVPMV